MKITYDSETDTLTLVFRDEHVHLSEEPCPGVVLDLDSQGRLVSCEILEASSNVDAPDVAPYFMKTKGKRGSPLAGAAPARSS